MRDLAIKYAVLCHQQRVDVPFKTLVKEFSDCDPLEAFTRFKKHLSPFVYGVLRFGFPDKALSDIVLHEHRLVLESEPPVLTFTKTSIDTESLRLAGAVTKEFSIREHDLVDSLSAWLVDATSPLFKSQAILQSVNRPDVPKDHSETPRVMFRELLKLYADKQAFLDSNSLYSLSSLGAMSHFTNAMTADALYKADAARTLFGENSSYYHAWLHQQMFRNLIAKTVRQFILSFAA